MRRITQQSGRAGFALPATLLAMFVIGAIVTGGFYISGQEHNVSMSTDIGTQALHAAEYGIEEQLAVWTNEDLQGLVPGALTRYGPFPAQAGEDAEYMVTVMPLRMDTLYMVQSDGRVVRGRDTATRRVARVVGASRTDLPYKSAMAIVGKLDAKGNSMIDGNDRCTSDAVPGVMAEDIDLVTGVTKSPNEDRIIGDPAVAEDPDISTTLDAYDLQKLIEQAQPQYRFDPSDELRDMAPSTYVGADGQTYCDTDDSNNWGGAPGCEGHYPILYSDGNMKLTTGSGQGVLIVNGDLSIQGNFEFSGVVIVTGTFTMMGTGSGTGKINGSVIAKGVGTLDTDETAEIAGNALIQYDSCEIERALNAALRLTALASRSWILNPPPL
ncbi:MAG: hypothetical protein ABR602_05310 [Gemmatimonadales bacterium]